MISNKKALQSHIIIMLIASLIMTTLILTLLGSFFTSDPKKCLDFKFEITDKCKLDNGIVVKIKNQGNTKIDFKTDSIEDYKLTLPIGKEESMRIHTSSDKVNIIPYFMDITGNNENICKGKTETINVERLMKCSS